MLRLKMIGVPAVLMMCSGAFPCRGDESLPMLQVGSQVYSNVTISAVTATDVYFSFPGGIGNAKLKNLSPELRRHFHFNPTNAAGIEQKRREENAQFRKDFAARKNSVPKAAAREPERRADSPDLVVPALYARSFRGQPAPELVVGEWLTSPPDTAGKFVLVEFWATWCGPCRNSIPHLNSLQAKFKDRLVVIGISDEPADHVRRILPQIQYAVAVDADARMKRTVRVTGIPHAMLMDPRGIVRFEGMPHYLDDSVLARLIEKYSD